MATGAASAIAAILVTSSILAPERAPPGLSLFAIATAETGGPLSVETQPTGATVFLDGEQLGTTPMTLPVTMAGRHRLRLTAENYQEWAADIQIPVGVAVQQRVALAPLPAQVSIVSPLRGARIWIDGSDRGPAPLSVEVEPGEHAVRVDAEGFQSLDERVALGPNERRSLFVAASGGEILLVPGDPSNGLAVVIDNQDDARPQFGLNRADVVYEALAEGGITRYLALFLTQEVDQIGPIRSARHYFVNWAREYLTPLVHIGSSPQGYQALATAPIPNVDGRAFNRLAGRPAPHNAVTSTAMIRPELRSRPPSNFGGLHFRFESREPQGTPVRGLRFSYGPGRYAIGWTYDAERDEYQRSLNDRTLPDASTGEPVVSRNVVVLWMSSGLIPDDDAGRLDFQQVGSGRLLALTDGVAIEGRWSRSSIRSVTEYRDTQGKTLLFTPGATWFQVIPPSVPVEVLGALEDTNGT